MPSTGPDELLTRTTPDRRYLAEYREEIARNGEMMVDDVAELIDLSKAAHEPLAIHPERQARKQVA